MRNRSLLAFVGLLLATEAADARPVEAVVAVGTTVSELDRSLAFYTSVLGFRRESEVEVAGPAYEELEGVFGARMRIATLRLGEERLVLTEYLAARGRAIDSLRSNDRAFQHIAIVVSDLDAAYRRLREHRVRAISTGPQRLPDWNPNAGGIRAFYFQDPDGHPLELIWFPPGKGDPKWQRATSKLFLGIDHTAIAVGDTDASLALYRDRLGLRVAGESENWGTEQEHLNNVFGARLRITSLRAARGPGIELLEYLSPRDGRPAPPDERANDLMHWQITLAPDPESASSARLVSPGPVELPDARLGFRHGALARDPDGHGLLFTDAP
jgi:catechol 2,3-dioxygenase-like lactoylglutathione lyase family enzyme